VQEGLLTKQVGVNPKNAIGIGCNNRLSSLSAKSDLEGARRRLPANGGGC
jgi:hypothetical protein